MSIEAAIIEEIETAIDDLQKELESKGFNYTGFASNSLRIDNYSNEESYNFDVWGADYIEFLEGKGRGKTRSKGNGTATKKIFEWVEKKLAPLKGITDEDEIESLKFAVAATIHKFGTQVHRKKRSGIDLEKILTELTGRIKVAVRNEAKVDVVKLLNKFKKRYEFNL